MTEVQHVALLSRWEIRSLSSLLILRLKESMYYDSFGCKWQKCFYCLSLCNWKPNIRSFRCGSIQEFEVFYLFYTFPTSIFFFFSFGLIFRQTLHMPAVTLSNPRLTLSSYLEIFKWGKTQWLMQKSRGKSWLSRFWTRAYSRSKLSIQADRTRRLATLGHELVPFSDKAGPCKWQFCQVGIDYFHEEKPCPAEK